MQDALPAHNRSADAAAGPAIAFGVGLHSGLVVAAHDQLTAREGAYHDGAVTLKGVEAPMTFGRDPDG